MLRISKGKFTFCSYIVCAYSRMFTDLIMRDLGHNLCLICRRNFMGSRDFISGLPDEVLGKKILSLLPTKLVVSTSVLSKRWRNLFHFVDNFDLEDSTSLRNDGFSDFMEKTVALLSNCPIKRLTLNCHYEQSSVHRWISSALQRGCLELNLQSQYRNSLDIGTFSSNTLVKLTLSSYRTFLRGNVPLDGRVFFPRCCCC